MEKVTASRTWLKREYFAVTRKTNRQDTIHRRFKFKESTEVKKKSLKVLHAGSRAPSEPDRWVRNPNLKDRLIGNRHRSRMIGQGEPGKSHMLICTHEIHT